MVLAAAGIVASPAATVVTPVLPAEVIDPPLEPMIPSYRSFNRPPFGSPCRICPSDAIQGALNDCALLSALAAVANVSPGTIEKALIDTGGTDAQKDEIYQISYWDLNRGEWHKELITSAYPAQSKSTTDTWYNNILHGVNISPKTLFTPFFIYAQLPARDQSWWSRQFATNDTTWALLMEKGYVAMPWVPQGYATPDLMNSASGKGLFSRDTLTQVTGFKTIPHEVKPTAPAKQVASVWIRNSPAMSDVGGRSIILGALHGNFKAVEPNLKTCIVPVGEEHARRPICTSPCPQSHICRASLQRPLAADSSQAIHVRVLDVDARSGAEHEIYAFDTHPGGCTTDKPCTFDVPASQWVLQGPLEVSFGMADADPLQSLDSLLTRLQKERAAVIVGSREKAQCPADDALCAQLFASQTPLVEGHAYYLKRYVRSPNGPTEKNALVIGDPHGGALAERTITLAEFYHSFLEIDENPTAHESSRCTCQ
jgi:hypothetical protein